MRSRAQCIWSHASIMTERLRVYEPQSRFHTWWVCQISNSRWIIADNNRTLLESLDKSLLLIDVQGIIDVYACQKIFDNSEWPKEILRNHLRFGRKLICSACRANGFTANCTDGRACTICEKKRGTGKFNKYARWDHSRRNSDLICDDCIDKKRCDGAKCDAILNKSAVSATITSFAKSWSCRPPLISA